MVAGCSVHPRLTDLQCPCDSSRGYFCNSDCMCVLAPGPFAETCSPDAGPVGDGGAPLPRVFHVGHVAEDVPMEGARFATIGEALPHASPGDILLVEPGEYPPLEVDCAQIEGACASGSCGLAYARQVRPLTIRARVPRASVIRGTEDQNPLRVEGCRDLRFEGLRIEGRAESLVAVELDEVGDIQLHDFLVHGTFSVAAFLRRGRPGIVIDQWEIQGRAPMFSGVWARETRETTVANTLIHLLDGKGEGVRIEGASRTKVEAVIVEGGNIGFAVVGLAGGDYPNAGDAQLRRCISVDARTAGFRIASVCPNGIDTAPCDAAAATHGTYLEHCVARGADEDGFRLEGVTDAQLIRSTSAFAGQADYRFTTAPTLRGFLPELEPSFEARGLLDFGGGQYGTRVDGQLGGWSLQDSVSLGNAQGLTVFLDSPSRNGGDNYDWDTDEHSGLRECPYWIGSDAPIRDATPADKFGADLSDLLQNPSGGDRGFRCGAVIAGINDSVESSCVGLSSRLELASCPAPPD